MTTLYLYDDAGGAFPNTYGADGTIDYATKSLVIQPDCIVPTPVPKYGDPVAVGTSQIDSADGTTTITQYTVPFEGFEYVDAAYTYPSAGAQVTATYTQEGTDVSVTETITVSSLTLDITPRYAEQVVRGSTRFTLGGQTFVDQAGVIYRDPSPETGAGSVAGTIDPSTGRINLTSWLAGGANTVALQAMTTVVGGQPLDRVMFRTPVAPIKGGTLQLRWSDLTGVAYTKTPDGTGQLEDTDCTISIDFERGIVHADFGRWRTVESLTTEDLAAIWYSAESIVVREGVESIWQPRPADASTVIYNAVAATYLPPDSALLGLDAAKLPPDGKALIFRKGQLVLVHHTDSLAVASLSPTQTIDCGRTRLYRVEIEDSTGKRLGDDQYDVNRELGICTMSASLSTDGFAAPWVVRHTVADLARTISTDINGQIGLMSALTHDYPADDAYCSGVLFAGTMQARVSGLFAQASWNGDWSDSIIGDSPLSQYDDVLYPIQITNAGCTSPGRVLVKFKSSTEFTVIHENVGVIGVGDINTDCAPINSLTGETYFTIDHRGWGSGWVTGNCLRFNLHSACYPIDLVRAVQPSAPSGLTDSVELLLIGNVDA